MGKKRVCIEEEVLFTDKSFFKDSKEHCYKCECHNGYAVGTPVDEDLPKIKVEYPLRNVIVRSIARSAEVLQYRGLYDLTARDITYGDIMMKYGKIVGTIK